MKSVVVLASAIAMLLTVPARTQEIRTDGSRGQGLRLDEDLRLQGRDRAADRRPPGVFDRPAERREQLRELDPAKLRAGRRTGRCHPVRLRKADRGQPGHQVAAAKLRGHREDLHGSEVRRRRQGRAGWRPTISSGASARTSVYGEPAILLSTPEQYYFTLPKFSEQGTNYGDELEKAVDLSTHPVLGRFPAYFFRNSAPAIRSTSCSPGTTGCRS